MECMWCEKNEKLYGVVKEIYELKSGILYIHRDQTHPGRCILALGKHEQKLVNLSKDEYMVLMEDIGRVVHTLTDVFSPDKVNILILGDKSTHMHIHICPKYKDGPQFGIPFVVDEKEEHRISEEELDERIARIKEGLAKWEKF